jgi:hypothetical protein
MTSFAFILCVLPLVFATGTRECAKIDRHHGGKRHARLDLHRGAVRAQPKLLRRSPLRRRRLPKGRNHKARRIALCLA